MLDELLDSLLLDKLPTREALDERRWPSCAAGAEDIEPILHSFKNAQQLRVGVRDILGKETIEATTGALSDIAEVCLEQIARHRISKAGRQARRADRSAKRTEHGQPLRAGHPGDGQVRRPRAELLQRPRPDLSLRSRRHDRRRPPHAPRRRRPTTSTSSASWRQRIIKVASQLGPLRPAVRDRSAAAAHRQSGSLATSLAEFSRYFSSGQGQLWERQALCKARVVFGSPRAAESGGRGPFAGRVRAIPGSRNDAESIWQMRQRMEDSATPGNLKRGPGGLVDIEFLVQMLQLKHAAPAARRWPCPARSTRCVPCTRPAF